MTRFALARGCARLQIVVAAVETVARIGNAAGEGRHDGKREPGRAADFGGIAVAGGNVERPTAPRDLEADERGTVAGDAHAPPGIVLKHYDRLLVQQRALDRVFHD